MYRICTPVLLVGLLAACSNASGAGSGEPIVLVNPPAPDQAIVPTGALPTADMAGQAAPPPVAAPAPTLDPMSTPGTDATNPSSVPPPSGLPDVTFEMSATIPVGAEKFYCIYGAFPTDRGVIAVSSAESHFTAGSHHLLAYRTSLTSIPLGRTGAFDCGISTFMTSVTGSYYEAQSPDSRRNLPKGIAHRFNPGEIVAIEAHYINVTGAPLDVHASLILHTSPLADEPIEAGSIMFQNFSISIPPGKKIRATKVCTLSADFNPILLWSHMHKQGIGFEATSDDPAAASLGMLYKSLDWSDPVPREYPSNPSVTLHKGTHITFSCDYANTTAKTITFGQSAETNEMCLLHGMYWPRVPVGTGGCTTGPSSQTTLP